MCAALPEPHGAAAAQGGAAQRRRADRVAGALGGALASDRLTTLRPALLSARRLSARPPRHSAGRAAARVRVCRGRSAGRSRVGRAGGIFARRRLPAHAVARGARCSRAPRGDWDGNRARASRAYNSRQQLTRVNSYSVCTEVPLNE